MLFITLIGPAMAGPILSKVTVGGRRQRRLLCRLCKSKRFLQADVADHIQCALSECLRQSGANLQGGLS